ALQQVIPMLPSAGQAQQAANWILVGCPPRLNRHTGRWLTHTAQKKWRQEWANEATSELVQKLETSGNTVNVRVAHGALTELTKQIKGEVGAARVIDARRPKMAVNLDPVTPDQPQDKTTWAVPGGVLAMGAAIVMVSE
ncbi:MAG: hypothetical protein ACKOXN_07085, partial [Limnohabitans sp.]